MIVYKIVNIINGKTYVGQTKQSLKKRYADHIAGANRLNKTVIGSAIVKYGVEAFCIEKICDCDSYEESNYMECKYISELNSLVPNGYNVTVGGKTHFNHSEETKSKLSIHNMGKPVSDKTREKIGSTHRGRKQSADWVAKRTSKRIGLKHSVETISRISKNKGAQPFIVTTLNGDFVGRWESASQCARDLNVRASHITSCLKGRLLQHKGYRYTYEVQAIS